MDDDSLSKLMIAYVLFALGFLICLVAIFVTAHSAIVDTAALHQYQQDCAGEVSTTKHVASDTGGCYSGDAQVTIVRQDNVYVQQHRYLRLFEPSYTYKANLSLPDGTRTDTTLSQQFGQAHVSYGGDCQVEVWNKNPTKVAIQGDTDQTQYSPPLAQHNDLVNLGLSILGVIAFGGLFWFFNRRDSALRYS